MKNLDEMRALAMDLLDPPGGPQPCPCHRCALARSVLELLPVVEAAAKQADAMERGGLREWTEATRATEQAVAAFRAANREGERAIPK